MEGLYERQIDLVKVLLLLFCSESAHMGVFVIHFKDLQQPVRFIRVPQSNSIYVTVHAVLF